MYKRQYKEIVNFTATKMRQLISDKQISSVELMEAHLNQINDVNPHVNAIVTLDVDLAMNQAKKSDKLLSENHQVGILQGLPTAHKDLVPTKGMRTTFGSPLYKNYIPDFSSLIVERMQSAGAITIGKTNTPEFGAGSQTYNEVFGETLNLSLIHI